MEKNFRITAFSLYFLKEDELILFGSRAQPFLKGGDINLCIKTNLTNYEIAEERKITFLIHVKKWIGEQKIDIVLRLKTQTRHEHIDRVIEKEGIKLI